LIQASGECVGLPRGVMGNSNVGHLVMGAGRVVRTDIEHINHEIQMGAFFS
jgi:2,3-bisphosphoglycerate-independent phosphoglycerate mutase